MYAALPSSRVNPAPQTRTGQLYIKKLFNSYGMGRLRNDLYCVEWDVKLYYTIPYGMGINDAVQS